MIHENYNHVNSLMNQLRENCCDGKGTDLEVLCPYDISIPNTSCSKLDQKPKYKTFYLHSCVVSISSDYFRTFPTPCKGRKLEEISSKTFETCLDFMYTGQLNSRRGTCKNKSKISCSGQKQNESMKSSFLTHDTISFVLAASKLLGIHNLSEKCFEYLELHLNHSNHLDIQEIAQQFHNKALEYKALRYSSQNFARDEIVLERRKFVSYLHDYELQYQTALSKRDSCIESLSQLNKKWEDILESQLEKCLRQQVDKKPSKDAAYVSNTDPEHTSTCPSYPTNLYKTNGGVGRLVFNDLTYVGESIYQQKCQTQMNPMHCFGTTDKNISAKEAGSQETIQNEKFIEGSHKIEHTVTSNEESNDHSKPPPPPTREQNEKYGIICSYSCLDEALEASDPGDRVYLMPGKYKDLTPMVISKSLEIIGLGDTSKDVYLSSTDDEPIFRITNGCVRILNLNFQTSYAFDTPEEERHDGEYNILDYRRNEQNHPICKLESDGKLFLEKCNFIHNTNPSRSCNDFSRVSGLYIEGGNMAIVKKCIFRGGRGSAIAVLNNSNKSLEKVIVHIVQNTFINVGQCQSMRKCCPIPAPVEFWKLLRSKDASKIIIGSIGQNYFTHNCGFPLALRGMTVDNSSYDYPYNPNVSIFYIPRSHDIDETFKNNHRKHSFKRDGFYLKVESNIMEKNGYGFSKYEMSGWKWFSENRLVNIESLTNSAQNAQIQLESRAKKVCSEERNSKGLANLRQEIFLIPDGESIMETYHFLFQDPPCQALVEDNFDETSSVESLSSVNIEYGDM